MMTLLKNSFSQKIKVWAKQLRVFNWVKNLIIFLPLLVYYPSSNLNAYTDLLVTFMSFCFLASAVYLGNDLHDVEEDQKHESRRDRPLTKGLIPRKQVVAVLIFLVLIGLTLSYFFNETVFAIAILYLLANFLYTYKFKTVPWAGVCLLIFFHILRFYSGIVAGQFEVSTFGFAFVFFVFFALAISSHQETLKIAWGEKKSWVVYQIGSALSLLVAFLFPVTKEAQEHFQSPQILWIALPLLLYAFHRFWSLSQTSFRFSYRLLPILKDIKLWSASLLMTLIVVAAKAGL